MPGFGVRIFPSGRRSFVVSYRTGQGTKRIASLGLVGKITLDQARLAARKIFAEVLGGADPAGARKVSRQVSAEAPRMTDLCERYMREHARPHKRPKSVEMDEMLWRVHVLPRIGTATVSEIRRDQVAALHLSLERTPYVANRVLSLLSKAFNLAEDWGWRPELSNPTRRIERYAERRRERVLSAKEIGDLGRALAETEESKKLPPSAIAAVRLLLFTGCRPGEILGLRWEWVDFDRQVIRLPEAKGDRRTVVGRTVWLNSQAVSVLEHLERLRGVPWVLPGPDGRKPLKDIGKSWAHLCRLAGIENATPYVLRHTFVTRARAAGVGLEEVSDLAGHSDIGLTKRVYHHSDDAQQRAAAEALGTYLQNLASQDQEPGR